MRARHEVGNLCQREDGRVATHRGSPLANSAMREVHTLAGGEIRLQLSDIHVQRTAKTERGRQEEMTYASKQYKNVYVGSSTSKILQQMSNITSCPSHRHGKHRRTTVRSVSSSKEGTHMTKLYGFTAEPSASATRVVNQEILKASVVVHQFPLAAQDKVNSRAKCWRRPLFPSLSSPPPSLRRL